MHVQAIERLRQAEAATYDQDSSGGRDNEPVATTVSVAPKRGTESDAS
jgi:hypothetical protein